MLSRQARDSARRVGTTERSVHATLHSVRTIECCALFRFIFWNSVHGLLFKKRKMTSENWGFTLKLAREGENLEMEMSGFSLSGGSSLWKRQ